MSPLCFVERSYKIGQVVNLTRSLYFYLYYSKIFKLNTSFCKLIMTKLLIYIRLRFGLANSIYIYLRVKINHTRSKKDLCLYFRNLENIHLKQVLVQNNRLNLCESVLDQFDSIICILIYFAFLVDQ